MQKIILFTLAIITADLVFAQPAAPATDKIIVPVINDKQVAIPHATVELLRSKDSVLVNAGITDTLGMAVFQQIANGTYLFRVSSVNYTTQYTAVIQFPLNESNGLFSAIALQPAPPSLHEVTVLSKKPFIQ